MALVAKPKVQVLCDGRGVEIGLLRDPVSVWVGVTGFCAFVLIAGSAWWVWDGGFAVTVSFYLFDSYTCKPDGRYRPISNFYFGLKWVSVNHTITAMAGLPCIHPMAWPVRRPALVGGETSDFLIRQGL